MKILITTSGTGSRLGELTKKRNKSLLKVGDKAVISHIIDSYGEKNNEFVITLGYLGKQVRDYLTLAHPKLKVTYVEVDKWEGPGSSLLYSMWCASEFLQEPFVFNCCDNILRTGNLYNFLYEGRYSDYNKIVIGDYSLINKYSTVELGKQEFWCNQNVLKFYKKNKDSSAAKVPYMGIAIIVDYSKFWSISKSLLNQIDSNDVDVFQIMLESGSKFNVANGTACDTGNLNDLELVNKNYKSTLTSFKKDNEEIYKVGDRIIKWSESEEKISHLVARQPFVMNSPKVQSKGQFLSYPFVCGIPMSECLDVDLFYKLLDEIQKNKNESVVLANTNIEEFYIKKTNERLKLFYGQFPEYVSLNNFSLNKRNSTIKICIEGLLNPTLKSKWHGDLILDNIIVTPEKEFVFIDWRTDYCGELQLGDTLYDLAKLNHSLYLNNKQLLENQFQLDVKIKEGFAEVNLDFQDSLVKRSCRKIMESYTESNHLNILTAIIWLNMAGLHAKDMPEMSKFLFWMAQAKLAGFLND